MSYYAKATDNNGAEGPKTTTSDIYFVQIRPFRKDYKPRAVAGRRRRRRWRRRRRPALAAAARDRRGDVQRRPRQAKLTADKFRENVVFLNLAQAKLREQVEELVGKLQARVGVVDPGFKAIAEALPKASAEMKTAEGNLKAQQAKEALSPEQRALKLLQDAEQQYELQVRSSRAAAAVAAAARARSPTTSRICSSSSSTSSRTSTRCSSAPSSRAAISRWTSSPRS